VCDHFNDQNLSVKFSVTVLCKTCVNFIFCVKYAVKCMFLVAHTVPTRAKFIIRVLNNELHDLRN